MFRGSTHGYKERVDVIGNDAFLLFVDDLEKLEELKLGTFQIGKEKLQIVTIMAEESRKMYDIGLPVLTPVLVRKKTIAEEIASLDVMTLNCLQIPMKKGDEASQKFLYEGYDFITLEKEIER